MRGFLSILLAAFLTMLQVSLLSLLPAPFSDISFPLMAITAAIFTDRPVAGAAVALVSGAVLDLHGIFPFGTETAILLGIFYLTRLLFRRFITNASLAAAFLLSSIIITMHFAALLGFDGLRVIFGAEPFIIPQDTVIIGVFFRMILVNGLLVVGILAFWKRLRDRFAHRFIIRV